MSSNRNDASKLVDNDNGTYWQSDGPARSHWVRLKIPPNVVIKQLSMYVVSADQSYMPHHIVLSGGMFITTYYHQQYAFSAILCPGLTNTP